MSTKKYLLLFLMLCVVIVALLIPFTSEFPDGLEKVAEMLGFEKSSKEIYTSAPLPDYSLPEKEGYVPSIISEIIGVITVLELGLLIGFLLTYKNKRLKNAS